MIHCLFLLYLELIIINIITKENKCDCLHIYNQKILQLSDKLYFKSYKS